MSVRLCLESVNPLMMLKNTFDFVITHNQYLLHSLIGPTVCSLRKFFWLSLPCHYSMYMLCNKFFYFILFAAFGMFLSFSSP